MAEDQSQLRADRDNDSAAVEHTVDDILIDGRMTGIPPNYAKDDAEDPSAQEAAIQSDEKDT
jgi:hypothetical protein